MVSHSPPSSCTATQEQLKTDEHRNKISKLYERFEPKRIDVINEIYDSVRENIRRRDMRVTLGNPQLILARRRYGFDRIPIPTEKLPEDYSIVIEQLIIKRSLFGLSQRYVASNDYKTFIIVAYPNMSVEETKNLLIRSEIWRISGKFWSPGSSAETHKHYSFEPSSSVDKFLYEFGQKNSALFD